MVVKAPAQEGVTDSPSVRVYSYATPQEKDSPDTNKNVGLQSLSDHGQQAFIEKTVATAKKPSDALNALIAKKKGDEGDSSGVRLVQQTQFDRTLVVSVGKAIAARPGDRLMRTIVEVTPSKVWVTDKRGNRKEIDSFQFAGYKVPTTAIALQNIAHVDNKVTTSVTGKLSPTLTGYIAGAGEADVGITSEKEGSADILAQYQALHVDLTPNRLAVIRESERGIDISGNTIITPITVSLAKEAEADAAVLIDSTTEFFKSGRPLPPEKVSVTPTVLQIPPNHPVTVDVKLIYQLRVPDEGSRKYYLEGEQSVAIESGVVNLKGEVLIRGDDVSMKGYHLIDTVKGGTLDINVSGINNEIIFDDYLAAINFAKWMNSQHAKKLGKERYKLQVQKGDFGQDQFVALAR